jgi:hypothetical protein
MQVWSFSFQHQQKGIEHMMGLHFSEIYMCTNDRWPFQKKPQNNKIERKQQKNEREKPNPRLESTTTTL